MSHASLCSKDTVTHRQIQWRFISSLTEGFPSPYKWPQDTIYQMRTHGEEVEELKSRISKLQEENQALKLEVNHLKAEKCRTGYFL